MKYLMILVLSLTSTLAMANNPRQFTGKYELVQGSCNLDIEGRAYVKLEANNGVMDLRVDVYNRRDYRMISIPANSRIDPAPVGNTSRNLDIKVSWPDNRTMKSRIIFNYEPRARRVVFDKFVALKNGVLTITELTNGKQDSHCEFIKL